MFDDATAELGAGPLEGSAAIAESIRGYLDACGPTQHLLGNVLVDVDLAAGTATSRAYVSDVHLGQGSRSELTFSTLGDYHDTWERDGASLAHPAPHQAQPGRGRVDGRVPRSLSAGDVARAARM